MERITSPSRRAITVALGALVVAIAAPAGNAADKVPICHGTASASNPYVLVSISANAKDTHLLGADGTAPGHGQQSAPDFEFKAELYESCAAQVEAGDTGGGQQ